MNDFEHVHFSCRKMVDGMEINIAVDDDGLAVWFVRESKMVMEKEWDWSDVVRHAPQWHIP